MQLYELASSMSVRLSNCSLSDDSEVPGRMTLFGQSPPLRRSVCIDNYPRQFQSTAGGKVPLDSGFAHPSTSFFPVVRVLG